LEDNAGADELVLAHDDLARIDAALPKGVASGKRYNDVMMKTVDA
ncbi:MAG: Aldo-keto reductase, partial [Labilithrix sp.]|nr:Aldo-keto reductase [Labilithrix sp.]